MNEEDPLPCSLLDISLPLYPYRYLCFPLSPFTLVLFIYTLSPFSSPLSLRVLFPETYILSTQFTVSITSTYFHSLSLTRIPSSLIPFVHLSSFSSFLHLRYFLFPFLSCWSPRFPLFCFLTLFCLFFSLSSLCIYFFNFHPISLAHALKPSPVLLPTALPAPSTLDLIPNLDPEPA